MNYAEILEEIDLLEKYTEERAKSIYNKVKNKCENVSQLKEQLEVTKYNMKFGYPHLAPLIFSKIETMLDEEVGAIRLQ